MEVMVREEIEKAEEMKKRQDMEKAREAHTVVAALVATVTFAAAITVPGGYKSDKGADQGTPFLLHDAAFVAFVISDALAFFCSITAIATHFAMLFHDVGQVLDVRVAAAFIVCSLSALLIAFYTGIFVVLRPSRWLSIFSICLGIFFHLVIHRITYPILSYCLDHTLFVGQFAVDSVGLAIIVDYIIKPVYRYLRR